MMRWLELCCFALVLYAAFCVAAQKLARMTPRPVARWFRMYAAWAIVAVSGFVISIPVAFPLLVYAKHHFNRSYYSAEVYFYFAVLGAWTGSSAFIVRHLFRDGGALCDEAIQHGRGWVQRIARSAIGPGDAARPGTRVAASRLRDLDLTWRD